MLAISCSDIASTAVNRYLSTGPSIMNVAFPNSLTLTVSAYMHMFRKHLVFKMAANQISIYRRVSVYLCYLFTFRKREHGDLVAERRATPN